MKKILISFLFVLLTLSPIYANNPPSPQALLAGYGILFFIAGALLISGNYKYYKEEAKKRFTSNNIATIFIGLLIVFLTLSHIGHTLLFSIVFMFFALYIAIKNIIWTKRKDNPKYFVPILASLVLVLYSLSAVWIILISEEPLMQSISERSSEDALKHISAGLISSKNSDSLSFKDFKIENYVSNTGYYWVSHPHREVYSDSLGYKLKSPLSYRHMMEIEYIFADTSFVIYSYPIKEYTFPNNHFFTYKTYRIDNSGELRMEETEDINKKCAADATVIYKLTETDIREEKKD